MMMMINKIIELLNNNINSSCANQKSQHGIMYKFSASTLTHSIQHDNVCALKKDKKRKITKKQKKEMLEIFKIQEQHDNSEDECETKKIRQDKKVISQSRKRKRLMKHNYLSIC
jgi:ABC-type lipopolysaccharide export system ATPase subunit